MYRIGIEQAHAHIRTRIYTGRTYELEMAYHSSSVSSLGHIRHTHTHTHTHACCYNSLPHSLSHTHTHTGLPQETYRPPLSVYELICLPQTGMRRGQDVYSVLWYGHVFHIINLLSNLPSALLTHLVILYSHLITYHKTVGCSQPSSASFETFWSFQGVLCCEVSQST